MVNTREEGNATILITWWAGYIGSHAVVLFEEAGYKTVIVDNLSNASEESLLGIEKTLGYMPDFFKIDLRDSVRLQEVFSLYHFEWVLHFAGLKAVGESCNNPLEYFDNNIIWTLELLKTMEKNNVKNIIFSSSATVYNIWNTLPYIESQGTGETSNTYSSTKYLIEKILFDVSRFSQFNVMNLRYFNPIWSDPRGYIWENPVWVPNNLLPYIMKVVLGELEYLQVFWNDYSTPDGTGVRDYVDVVDLVRWHILAYEKLIANGKHWYYDSFNLWTWRGVSVLEMIHIAENGVDNKIDYRIVGRRKGDIAEMYCSPDKAYKELWWKSETDISTSVENSWRFYKNHTL